MCHNVRMKIIANLICLNSAPELPTLLESLKGRVDGIVAVDGGSTDATVDMLNDWGMVTGTPVLVKTNAWPDDFGAQRNLCLNITRAEYGLASPANDVWVLMIDCDDTLTEFDRDVLEKACAGFAVSGLMVRMDNGNGFFFVVQFFRLNADARWVNPIHEYLETKGPKGMPPTGSLTIKRGRSAQHDSDPLRNVRIGRRFVEQNAEDSRGRFYLGRDTMECDAIPLQQRRAEAEGHLRAYLALNTGFITQDRYALLLLVRLLSDMGRYEEARKLLLDWIAKDPDNKSAYEAMSRLTTGKEAGVWHRH